MGKAPAGGGRGGLSVVVGAVATGRRSRALRGPGGPPALQLGETFVQQVLELGDRAPLEQHVPVGARRLDLLLLGLPAIHDLRLAAVQAAFPDRRDLGVVGERHLELVVLRAGVAHGTAGSEVVVAVGLVADRSQPASTKNTVGYDGVLSVSSGWSQGDAHPMQRPG